MSLLTIFYFVFIPMNILAQSDSRATQEVVHELNNDEISTIPLMELPEESQEYASRTANLLEYEIVEWIRKHKVLYEVLIGIGIIVFLILTILTILYPALAPYYLIYLNAFLTILGILILSIYDTNSIYDTKSRSKQGTQSQSFYPKNIKSEKTKSLLPTANDIETRVGSKKIDERFTISKGSNNSDDSIVQLNALKSSSDSVFNKIEQLKGDMKSKDISVAAPENSEIIVKVSEIQAGADLLEVVNEILNEVDMKEESNFNEIAIEKVPTVDLEQKLNELNELDQALEGSEFTFEANIFPNPSVDGIVKINLKRANESINEGIIHVFDPTGKLVITQQIFSDQQTIDLSVYNSGMYMIQISFGTNRLVKRLIKR